MKWNRVACSVAAGALLGSGCQKENEFVPPPPPKVTVATPVVQDVTSFLEFTGRFEAVEDVGIVARVTGFVSEVRFEDGQAVSPGSPLYLIDPAEYQAAVDKAKADLELRKAEQQLTDVELKRFQNALAQGGVSDLEVIRAQANLDKATAEVQGAEATLERAMLDLGYTDVKSPIKGLVGRTSVHAGDLVGPGATSLLTNVVRQDPIQLYFTASERDVLAAGLRFSTDVRTRVQAEKGPPIYAVLTDGSLYPETGQIDFIDNQVDPDTGTIGLRAKFPNPEGQVTPGLFARIRIPRTTAEAMLVPETALQRDAVGSFLLAVNDAKEVVRLDVERGVRIGTMRVITSGLKATDRLIVVGLQRARPGIVVAAEETTLAPAVQPELGIQAERGD